MHSCSLCRRQIESHRVLAAKAENTYLVSLGAVPTLVSGEGIYDVYDKEDKEHDDDEEVDADSNDDDDEELEQDVGG